MGGICIYGCTLACEVNWAWFAMGVSQVVTYQQPVSIVTCDPLTTPVTFVYIV